MFDEMGKNYDHEFILVKWIRKKISSLFILYSLYYGICVGSEDPNSGPYAYGEGFNQGAISPALHHLLICQICPMRLVLAMKS